MAQKGRKPIQPHDKNLQNPMALSLSLLVLTDRGQLLAEIKDGTAKECFATHLYENRVEYGLNDHETMFAGTSSVVTILMAVLNAIEGGSDTTRATLNLFTAAMATHPDFVERARKELDAVCGDAGRLPTFEDQARLPLVTAAIKETLRWKPFVESGISTFWVVLITGVVRVLIKDDHFEDYYFPAGTRFSITVGGRGTDFSVERNANISGSCRVSGSKTLLSRTVS